MTALELLHRGTVIPAIPLALDERRSFDEKRQRALARYYLACGVGGIAVGVHTTQFEIRDHGLYQPVLAVTVDEIKKREQQTGAPVVKVAGVCGKTPQAVAEAETAKALGFDAVLLNPGGLSALSEQDMLERTRAVAAVLPVIGFYLQNSVGGRRLSFSYWRRLCDIENVVAVKAAPFDRYQTIDLVRGCAFSARRDKVALYTGNDDNIVVDLLTPYHFEVEGVQVEKRFVGGLLGHWSVWTRRVVELYAELENVRGLPFVPAHLLTLAAQITDANAAVFDVANNFRGCIAGIHEVLRRQGLLRGIWCLDPAEALSPGQAEELDRVCAAYPHLADDTFVRAHLKEWLS